MKNRISKLGGILIPIILCIALLFTAFMSISSIDDLQGNARVINYTGIVRGATQRLIKKELHQVPDDNLIKRLDSILSGLSDGSDELNLVKLKSEKYQALLSEMRTSWDIIKAEIVNQRKGSSDQSLYEMSEDYFELADQTVFAAEEYTEQIVQDARRLLIIMNTVFILMAGGCTMLTLFQEKRRNQLIKIENENKKKSDQVSKRLQELLVSMNEISELMYVSDLETYDLLFINEAGKQIFQVNDDTKIHKCYKVLQGFDAPCPFCTSRFLKMDETYSWEHTNPLTKKHYLLKDRLIEWQGHAARMEIAFDITEADKEKTELKAKLERDGILLDCIRELYRNHDITKALTNVLNQIGRLFSADRAYILLFQEDKFSNIAEWCETGIAPQIEYLQNLPLKDYRIWFDILEKQETIAIDDIKVLKETMPLGYEFLAQQGINNIIWVPLEKDEKLNGCLGLDNQAILQSRTAIPFLQTIQYFITLAMQRNENEKSLFELSYLDKLTSFYNRNCYIQDIDELERKHTKIGVIYLDVNGLKEVNDHFGHDAGDKLLKTCADIIKDSCHTDKLYRIGGDEFVIIFTEVKKHDFHDLVQQLRNDLLQKDCNVAIGFLWEKDSQLIQKVIKDVDILMYANKKEFYEHHPATHRYRHNDHD